MESLFLVTGGVCSRKDHSVRSPIKDNRFYFALVEAKQSNADQDHHDNGRAKVRQFFHFMKMQKNKDEERASNEGKAK